jgi:hypothetical protein
MEESVFDEGGGVGPLENDFTRNDSSVHESVPVRSDPGPGNAEDFGSVRVCGCLDGEFADDATGWGKEQQAAYGRGCGRVGAGGLAQYMPADRWSLEQGIAEGQQRKGPSHDERSSHTRPLEKLSHELGLDPPV